MNAIEDYHTISFEGNNSLLEIVEVTDNFVSEVMKQRVYRQITTVDPDTKLRRMLNE